MLTWFLGSSSSDIWLKGSAVVIGTNMVNSKCKSQTAEIKLKLPLYTVTAALLSGNVHTDWWWNEETGPVLQTNERCSA
jgi:hypothetical protein